MYGINRTSQLLQQKGSQGTKFGILIDQSSIRKKSRPYPHPTQTGPVKIVINLFLLFIKYVFTWESILGQKQTNLVYEICISDVS